MTVGGRFLSRLVTMLVALVGLVVVGAVPAVAEPNSGTIQYVALGDSYAAGQGGVQVGDYLDETCLESPNGYPYLLDAQKRIHLRTNVACTGATTSDVIREQLSALNRGTRLVTLTVGAADLGLSQVLTACTDPTPTDCQTEILRALNELGGLGASLTDLYAMVAAEAPNALIVVTGYPYLFDQPFNPSDCPLPTTTPPPPPSSPEEIMELVNCATFALNSTIYQAVLEAKRSGIHIEYVDVTGAFSGHGIGSAVPFINPPQAGLPAAFHPNAAGYVAYAEAISEVLQSA
jgi:lysophospholipase L1-like esterase